LSNGFKLFIDQKYHGKQMTQHQAAATEAGLGSVLGSFGKVFSLADCGVNMFNPIRFAGGPMQTGPYMGFTPDMLGTSFTGFKDECCPFCKAGVQAMTTSSGRVICAGCGNFYDMGHETHAKQSHAAVRAREKTSWKPQTKVPPRMQQHPQATEAITSVVNADTNNVRGSVNALFTGFLLN
jgi:hypothetical protein